MISTKKTQIVLFTVILMLSVFAYAADYTYWCEDTDGDNPQASGSITYGRRGSSYDYNYTLPDYCIQGTNTLYERICVKKNRTDLYDNTVSGFYPKTKTYSCECDPEQDVCNSSPVTTTTLPYQLFCVDSDGDNPNTVGSVTYGNLGGANPYNRTYTDFCYNTGRLYERICVNNYTSNKIYNCNCSKGRCLSSTVTTTTLPNNYFCEDSDGDEPTTAGSVTYGNLGGANPYNRTYTDYCYSRNVLYERICSNNYISSKRYNCDCVNDSCISTPVTTTTLPVTYFCSDPDGNNPYIKSFTGYGRTGGTYSFNYSTPDMCLNNTTLYERICRNYSYYHGEYVGYIRHTCEIGCVDGECISIVTTTSSTTTTLLPGIDHGGRCVNSSQCAGDLECKTFGDYPHLGRVCCYSNECGSTDGCMREGTVFFSNMTCIDGDWSVTSCSVPDSVSFSPTQGPFLEGDYLLIEDDLIELVDAGSGSSYGVADNQMKLKFKSIDLSTLSCSIVDVVLSAVTSGDPVYTCRGSGDQYVIGDAVDSDENSTSVFTGDYGGVSIVFADGELFTYVEPVNEKICCVGDSDESTFTQSNANEINQINPTDCGVGDLPDLVVEELIWRPASPVFGVNVSVYGRIKNIGEIASGDFNYAVYINGNKTKQLPFESLHPNQTTDIQLAYQPFSLGVHEIKLQLDSLDEVSELNEDNNELAKFMNVTSNPASPDLRVEDIWWTPSNPSAGDDVVFHAKIRNIGEGPATTQITRFYFDSKIEAYLGQVEWLYSGESRVVDLGPWYGFELTDGVHEVKVTVDSMVDESNETDNNRTEFMYVGDCPSITLEGVLYYLSPCRIDAKMVDGAGDKYFNITIKQHPRSLYGFQLTALHGNAVTGTWSGGAVGEMLLKERFLDAVLDSESDDPAYYSVPLPIEIFHGSYSEGRIDSLTLSINLTIYPPNTEDWCSGADITQDGQVGLSDLSILAGNYNKTGCGEPRWCGGADITQDGEVDIEDLSILASHYGFTNCTGPSIASPIPTTTTPSTTVLTSDSPTGMSYLVGSKIKRDTPRKEVNAVKNCRANNLCAHGEGDCSSNNACEPGLICRKRAGRLYGYSSNVDVCVKP